MISTICAICDAPFGIYPYRFKAYGRHSCSRKCSEACKRKFNLGPPRVPKDRFYKIQFAYEKQNKTIKDIAAEFDCSYPQVERWARKYGWIKFQRTISVRATYRKLAAEKLGRPLAHGEHVHHIDGVIINNSIENLHVFRDARKHSECHGSLERAAFELYRRGFIRFNPNKGEYYLPNKRIK